MLQKNCTAFISLYRLCQLLSTSVLYFPQSLVSSRLTVASFIAQCKCALLDFLPFSKIFSPVLVHISSSLDSEKQKRKRILDFVLSKRIGVFSCHFTFCFILSINPLVTEQSAAQQLVGQTLFTPVKHFFFCI